ncbi:hypothetical protein [Actinokineospora sp. NPDC004072]
MRTTARRLGTIIGAALFACGLAASSATATNGHPVEPDGHVLIDPGAGGSQGDPHTLWYGDWQSYGSWLIHAQADGVSWTQLEEWVVWDDDDEEDYAGHEANADHEDYADHESDDQGDEHEHDEDAVDIEEGAGG